ncbi:Uma2 family endonuclease [Frigoriglobus tundricola]|uniref:Putative restriction endonuclease domain-containing protein n=1 Tax=Frigoriglobus tundricola TaxID=2774151 RepID=A0A6M5YIV8_9BACT|nr:Uma2 family endonuclease [Frigoriglobus tundricola]QJW93484.1 hypothetical protein FTUN_0990 [Frigoriglobus tundricola]
MGTRATKLEFETAHDLLVSLGNIPPWRVWMHPAPGTARVRDVTRVLDRYNLQVELVDRVLVEKAISIQGGFVAMKVAFLLYNWNDRAGDRGMITGAGGTFRLLKQVVRIPSVAFTNWDRLPGRHVPSEPVPDLAPDLAVEVLSEGNTRAEMERKLKEYFLSEVQLVWYIDPRTRTVRAYTSPDDVTELGEADTLDGGAVLPVFSAPVVRLFDHLAPAAKSAKPPKASGGKKPKKQK